MRYPAAEKLEIIRLVEQSPLPVRHTVAKLGIPRAIFYRWYDRYSCGGPAALDDRSPRPDRVWNRIPEPVRQGNREGRVETEVLDLTDRAAAAAWIAEIERTTGGLTRLRSISGFAPAVTFGGERREAARVCNGLGRFFSPDVRSATSGAVDMRNAAAEHHSYRGRETDHHGYFPSGKSRGREGEPVAQIYQDHGHACGHHQTAAGCLGNPQPDGRRQRVLYPIVAA
jgi:transposase-like protein